MEAPWLPVYAVLPAGSCFTLPMQQINLMIDFAAVTSAEMADNRISTIFNLPMVILSLPYSIQIEYIFEAARDSDYMRLEMTQKIRREQRSHPISWSC